MNCPRCGSAVVEATLAGGQKLLLEEHREDGQVLMVDGRATFLNGKLLSDARRLGLPIYRRHNVFCPKYWAKPETWMEPPK
jgi:hypothetical protein